MNSVSVEKCGFVAILGRPNAGKSTLVNACVGAKISIVSNKPQTTRNQILGLVMQQDTQICFLDTPGIHRNIKGLALNKWMNKEAWRVLDDAHVVCYCIDSTAGFHREDGPFLEKILSKTGPKVFCLFTKGDAKKSELIETQVQFSKEKVEEIRRKLKESAGMDVPLVEFLEISSKRPTEVQSFLEKVASLLPEGPHLYPKDQLTDRPTQFVVGELIREQVFRQLAEELPYQCAVVLDKFEPKVGITHILATIVVQKENHKGMVIGSRGSRIKEIGVLARESIEKLLGHKIYLELFVKVQEGWASSDESILDFTHILRE